MTEAQIDDLVRRIGDELLRRVGSPAAEWSGPSEASCGCSHVESPAAGAHGFEPSRLEQAAVRPGMTRGEVERVCVEAARAGLRSVWTPTAQAAAARRALEGSTTAAGALVGHPWGDAATPLKLFEAETALRLGAQAVDATISAGALRSGELEMIFGELRGLARLCRQAAVPLRVALPTNLLDEKSLAAGAALCRLAGASAVRAAGTLGDGRPIAPASVRLLRRALGDDFEIAADCPGDPAVAAALGEAGASLLVASDAFRLARS